MVDYSFPRGLRSLLNLNPIQVNCEFVDRAFAFLFQQPVRAWVMVDPVTVFIDEVQFAKVESPKP